MTEENDSKQEKVPSKRLETKRQKRETKEEWMQRPLVKNGELF